MIETVALKTGKARRTRKNVRRLAADKGYDGDELRNFFTKKASSRKNECQKKMEAANAYHCTTIPSRMDFLFAAKKVPAARRATGTIAELFRCVSLFGTLFYCEAVGLTPPLAAHEKCA